MIIGAFLYIIGGFIEVIIALRFVFELIGANPASQIVNWIYTWSTPFVTPFTGIIGKSATTTGVGAVTTSVFDWTALIALVIYGLLLSVLSAFTRRYSY
jgi:uncharacterized protein YggT (Ycf19 family)